MWQFHRVMKTTETLKEHDFKPKYEALLRGLLGRVPFVKVKSFGHIAEAFGNQPDWLVEVKAGERPWVLAVESKRHGQPREVRNGLLQLRQFLDQTKGKSCYGVLVAPFLSEESARLCTEAGIGYADLAGNAQLAFDQVFIATHATDNPFREKRETRSLFAPRATRVLRVLLQGPLRPWKVTELAESARVSLGWVSAVRQQLLAREWAEAKPKGLSVSKPAAILTAWAAADRWEDRTEVQEYSSLVTNTEQLAERVEKLLKGKPHAFTQWFAGWFFLMIRRPP